MAPLTHIAGLAAALLRPNIDTDLIIPSREITSPGRGGYADKLFAPWRYLDGGRHENPDFVLNREPFRKASVLIAGDNFGCGSSREMAVWALQQFGIRCVIAPSFGAIFRDNCLRNGLLPLVLGTADVQALGTAADGGTLRLEIDIANAELAASDGRRWHWGIAAHERDMLLSGRDAIDATWQHRAAIEAFEQRDRIARPWAWVLPL